MTSSGSVSRVAVVGAGVDAWLSALGLARAFGALGVEVEVLEPPTDPTPAALDALPAIRRLHDLIGVTEHDVVSRCAAVPSLGQRFHDWTPPRPAAGIRAYATLEHAPSHLEFIQHWLRARDLGLAATYSDFSPAAAAIGGGRAPPLAGPSPIDHGYHLDGPAYAALLRDHALALGVRRRTVRCVTAVRTGGRIDHLALDDDETAQADLFIDASGDAALLADQAWCAPAPHPFRRRAVFVGDRPASLQAVTETWAWEGGWTTILDVQSRRAAFASFDDRAASTREVGHWLETAFGARFTLESEEDVDVGARDGWSGNCVALGRSAVRLELLDGGWLLGLQIGLTHLIDLFPLDAAMQGEARTFNAEVRRHIEAAQDFQTARYRLATRTETCWREAAGQAMSPALAARLDLFAMRGTLPPFEDEAFQADDWRMMLTGHGLAPREANPMVRALDDARERRWLHDLMRRQVAAASALPTVEEWLAARRAS